MVKFRGSLSKIGLPRLLHSICMEADAFGVLELTQEAVRKRIYFKDGRPSFAVSNVLNEVLGRLLMEEGLITETAYKSSLEIVIKEKRRHGEVLISMGLLTEDKINEFLNLQLKKRVWKAFGWKEANYTYSKADTLSQVFTQFPQNTAEIIIEGLSLGYFPITKIHAELTPYMNKVLPGPVDNAKYKVDDLKLNLQEKRFIERFDGVQTTAKIVENSDLLFSRTLAIVYTLVLTGLVGSSEHPVVTKHESIDQRGSAHERVREEASVESRLAAELLFVRARIAIKHQDYSSAISMLKEITALNPDEGEYLAYLAWATFLENPSERAHPEIMIQDALKLNKDNAVIWHFLGKLRLSSGNYSGAKEAFERSLVVNRWMIESLFEIKLADLMSNDSSDTAVKAREEASSALGYFSFHKDPFNNDPDPINFLRTVAIEDTLDLMADSIRKSAAPMLLSGERGAGKSTAALELLLKLKDDKVMCAFLLTPPPYEKSLLGAINAEIGAERTNANATAKEELSALAVAVTRNKSSNGITLVIIDEAHKLKKADTQLIQDLARLNTIRFLFVAEPLMNEKLAEDDFKELNAKIVRYEMKSLTNEETAKYISVKLATAVKSSVDAPDISFTDEAVWTIFGESRGIPARINDCCRKLIAAAANFKSSKIDRDIARTVYSESSLLAKEPEQVWDLTPTQNVSAPAQEVKEPIRPAVQKEAEPKKAAQPPHVEAREAKAEHPKNDPAIAEPTQKPHEIAQAPAATHDQIAQHDSPHVKIDFKSIEKEVVQEKRVSEKTDSHAERSHAVTGEKTGTSSGTIIAAIIIILILAGAAWYFFLRP